MPFEGKLDRVAMSINFEVLTAGLRNTMSAHSQRQFWLGIVGAPGAGKSTLSLALWDRFGSAAVVIPMDGYHYYRTELDAMPHATEAHRRRGAPFTFNAKKFVDDLTLARQTGSGVFPSFQHGIGDPAEDDIELLATQHRLVIVEGNYLLLDDEPWCHLAAIFDETWFIDVRIDTIRQRLRQRFLEFGMSADAARDRVESNDIPNAKLIQQQCRPKANRIFSMDAQD